MNQTVFVDLDGVIVDLLPEWLRKYWSVTGDHVEVSAVTTYDFSNLGEVKSRALMSVLSSDLIDFARLDPCRGAINGLRRLQRTHEVFLLSDPPTKRAATDKLRWVGNHLGPAWVKRTVLTGYKFLLAGPGRILVDDAPHNILGWRSHGGLGVVLDHPYNKEVAGPTAAAFSDFVDRLQRGEYGETNETY